MFILPYILKSPLTSSTAFSFTTAWIFTIHGGAGIWQTDEESLSEEDIVSQYLEPNGFTGVSKGIHENCLLYEVDPSRTNLADFYLWTDFLGKGQAPPEGCDIWRPFFWVGESQPGQEDAWGWEAQTSELNLGKFGSVNKIWKLLDGLRTS